MPDVAWNKQKWDGRYHWQDGGDVWSGAWGGPEAQWRHALLPRISAFLPAGTILEIAPGHGRWTQFLKDRCDRMVLVDLSEQCIASCRRRFADQRNMSFHVNDGRSLGMVADESVDFAFSFDSLVHADADVIESYLGELRRKLRPDGVGFIHHSNLGEYRRLAWLRRLGPLKGLLKPIVAAGTRTHSRAADMTASKFERLAERAGLRCISQELVNWLGRPLIDCLSVFTRRESAWAGPNRVLRNPDFMREAEEIRAFVAASGDPPSATPAGPPPRHEKFSYAKAR